MTDWLGYYRQLVGFIVQMHGLTHFQAQRLAALKVSYTQHPEWFR